MRPFFFFNDTATTEIYTLSLHDALPISFLARSLHWEDWRDVESSPGGRASCQIIKERPVATVFPGFSVEMVQFFQRPEHHTSRLQSHTGNVCRLLLVNHTLQHMVPYITA